MTYQEWSQQYTDSANILKEKLSNLKKELKTAALQDISDINYRIGIMQSMYTECVRIANKLKKRKGEV